MIKGQDKGNKGNPKGGKSEYQHFFLMIYVVSASIQR